MDGMTHRIHLPGQLLLFRWPVPPASFLSDSAFLLSLRVLYSPLPSPMGLPEQLGGGQGPVSCGEWRAAAAD